MRWVEFVHRHAASVATLVLAGALASVLYVATHLSMNTDTEDMLSPELPFRRDSIELSERFPQFSDNILIVIDGENADRVNDGADALVARLSEAPELFGGIYDPLSGPYFRRSAFLFLELDELRDLANRLAEAQPLLGTLSRDPSLRGLFEVLGLALETLREGGDDVPLEMQRALAAIADAVEAQNAGRPGSVSWQSLMAGEGEATERPRLILIQPAVDFASLAPAAQAMAALREIARELGLTPERGVRVRLTGSVPLAQEELESVADGMGLAALLSLVLVLGLLFLGLRSSRLVVATLVTLLAGLAFTAAFASAAVGKLNLLSVAFAVLFIGLSVDFGIHFALRFQEEIDAGHAPARALERAAGAVGGALVLTAVAAALSFLSFLPTDYRGLAELGLISSAGMFIALAANLTLLPALLALAPPAPRPGKGQGMAAVLAVRTTRFIRQHAGGITVLALGLGVLAIGLLPQVRFDFDPFNLRDPEAESVATLRDLMEDPRTSPYSITVLATDLDAAVALAGRLGTLPEVDGTATLADYVPDDQEAKLAVLDETALFLLPSLAAPADPAPDPAAERAALAEFRERLDALLGAAGAGQVPSLRGEAERLAEALARFEPEPAGLEALRERLLAGLPGRLHALREALEADVVGFDDLPAELVERQIAANGAARLEVFPVKDLRDREALGRFVAAVRGVAPHATGAPVVILEAGNTVVRAFLEAASLSLAGVALLLFVVLRRPRQVLLVLVPLALSVLWTAAASVLLSLPFNFANVVVLPLQFGLGVAGAVHLVTRERQERAAGAALETSTPRAVLFSGLTTVGSFGTIALSSHPGTASMGILLTIAIGLTLAATLIVLPALLVRFPGSGPARGGGSP